MSTLYKPLKLIGLIFILWLGIGSAIMSLYKFQLQSKIETLIHANQSMRHYQGMTYDLTGLGPFIAFNIEKGNDYELGYIKLTSGKNVYERTFDVGPVHPFNNLPIKINDGDIQAIVTAKMSSKNSLWFFIHSLLIMLMAGLAYLLLKLIIDSKNAEELSSLAKQVAHDIRSPLEVLKGLKDEVKSLPDDSKLHLLKSINRIEEITDNLLKTNDKGKISRETISTGSEEILSLLESILIEKKLEYSAYDSIEFITSFSPDSYGLFSDFPRGSLKRVISNVINNSVEALKNKSGKVSISLQSHSKWNIIEIVDTGIGIPAQHMNKIIKKGYTTKEKGSGLGLSSAFKEISSMGGLLEITSEIDKGTKVSIKLLKAAPPAHFVTSIDVFKYQKVIILDDDSSLHALWKNKFGSSAEKIESFYSVKTLLENYKELPTEALLLCDFELNDDELDGIDVITHYKKRESILTTARSEESAIQKRCNQQDIKLLPKSVISYIGVKASPPLIVLIDDDRWIRMRWENFYRDRNLPFICFSNVGDFIKQSSGMPKETCIYIDSNLGEEIKGEIVSESIFKLGFTNIFLATGYSKEDIVKPEWIKGIHTKSPPEA